MPRPSAASSRLLRAAGVVCSTGLVLAATPSRAATVTDVADGGEPNKSVSFNIDLRYRYDSRNLTVTREQNDANGIFDASELLYARSRSTLDATLTLGVYKDLEFHVNIPYVASDAQNWKYASVGGASVEAKSSIQNNYQAADGSTLATARPLATVPANVNRSGIGDPSIGFAWGIFNEARENTLPETWYPKKSRVASWVVGADYTIPLASAMNPWDARNSIGAASSSLPVGMATHRFDFWTAMSKRVGKIEPFFKLHYTLPVASSSAPDNCSIIGAGADGKAKDPDYFFMSKDGQDSCNPAWTKPSGASDSYWVDKNKLQPSHVGGIVLGTEFHPIDKGENGPALHITLQASGDYVSNGRNVSDISDLLGKLTYTSQFFAFTGRLAVDYRFSKYVHWYTFAAVGTETTHFLTNEVVGTARSADPKNQYVHLGDREANEVNPSYDFRMDVPGHRFKAAAVTNWSASTMLSLNF